MIFKFNYYQKRKLLKIKLPLKGLMYQEQIKRNLCNKQEQLVSSNVYVTLFRGLSLTDYIQARTLYCSSTHSQPCLKCSKMLNVASNVLTDGYVLLSITFKQAFSTQIYKSDVAILRFLQMSSNTHR